MRAIIGFIKGGLIGAILGYGFAQLGSLAATSPMQYMLYGLIGAAVGLVAGKPLWRHETIWTPVVKVLFGVGICIGIYALLVKALGDPSLGSLGLHGRISAFPQLLGTLAGASYGIFVEVDDGEPRKKKA